MTIVILHRGCVSGHVIQNIRDKIGNGEGDYDWDAIDGYDELGLVSSRLHTAVFCFSY